MIELISGLLLGIVLGWLIRTLWLMYQMNVIVRQVEAFLQKKESNINSLIQNESVAPEDEVDVNTKKSSRWLKHTLDGDMNYWWLMSSKGVEEEFAFQSTDVDSAAVLCLQRYGKNNSCTWRHAISGESYQFVDGCVKHLG